MLNIIIFFSLVSGIYALALCVFNNGRYFKKCKGEQHYFKIITPTLARRAVTLRDKACQCGKHANVNSLMKENAEKFKVLIN